jgi:hypothetical protein
MAKKRYISDSIWTDNWFENQTPEKKLLFIYLITNKLVSICWFYEITIRQISFDTWINQKEVETYLNNFEDDKKVFFNNWIICIVNFVKNQNINSIEDNLYKWIIREIKELWEEKLITMLNYKGLMTTLQGAYKIVPIPYLTLLNFTWLNYTYQGSGINDIIVDKKNNKKTNSELVIKNITLIEVQEYKNNSLSNNLFNIISLTNFKQNIDIEKFKDIYQYILEESSHKWLYFTDWEWKTNSEQMILLVKRMYNYYETNNTKEIKNFKNCFLTFLNRK